MHQQFAIGSLLEIPIQAVLPLMSQRSITFGFGQVDFVKFGEVVGCSFTAPTLCSDGHLELLAQAKHLRVNTRYISQVIHGVIDGVKVSCTFTLINPVTKVHTAREEPKRIYKVLYVNVTALAVITHTTANDVAKLWWYFSFFLNNAIGLVS